jgi:hypothetical protein
VLGTMLAYASQLAAGAVSVWFISWAIRRRYDLDYQLTRKEHIVRWAIVAVGFGLAFLQGAEFEVVRIAAGLIALGFLAWPNFARSLVALVARFRMAA